jgi:hypothetical protein
MATPIADSYTAASGAGIYGGRTGPANALATAVAAMSAGAWSDWSSSTNVQAITDTGPDGPTAWLESTANMPLTNWPGKVTWDSARHQIVAVGTAQGYTSDTPPGTHASAVYLDTMTGLFSKTWNPFNENTAHIYDGNCSVSMAGKIYRKPYNSTNLWKCDLSTRLWTLAKSVSPLALSAVCNLDVFPDLGTLGSIIFSSDGGKLSRWDIATDALTTIGTYSGIDSYTSIHYIPSNGSVIFGGGTSSTTLYKLDSAGAVTTVSGAFPPGITGTGSGVGSTLTPDPSGRAKSWLFVPGGNVYDLDHASGTWSDHGMTSSVPSDSAAAACHGLGAVVFLRGYGRASSTVSNSTVHVFKVI